MSKKSKKPKKEKPIYIDDGRTIADMSALSRGRDKRGQADGRQAGNRPAAGNGKWRAYTKTYFAAVRMMFVPMLVTIGIISVAFFIMWLIVH